MIATPSYREIVELFKNGMAMEAQEKIARLREVCLELQDDNRVLKTKVETLERALVFSKQLHYVAPFYYAGTEPDPYCPRCWDKDRAAIHLPAEYFNNFLIYRDCPECKAQYIVRYAS